MLPLLPGDKKNAFLGLLTWKEKSTNISLKVGLSCSYKCKDHKLNSPNLVSPSQVPHLGDLGHALRNLCQNKLITGGHK